MTDSGAAMVGGRRPLTPRQEVILRMVVDRYIATGQPVGSKHLAGHDDVSSSASTIRYELAHLEREGYLGHPHTSAGRVPTDTGYRYYVDVLVDVGRQAAPDAIAAALQPTDVRREIDSALRRLADALGQVTSLLGVVTAPQLVTATIRHVDVLALQPQLVMVVVITSTGSVLKRVVHVDSPVEQRMADWAAAFFNDRLVGLQVGARTLTDRLDEPGFTPREARLVAMLTPAMAELDADEEEGVIYIGGQARFMSDIEATGIRQLDAIMRALEERYVILALLRGAIARTGLYLRIGDELAAPGLSGLSMVAANYGVARRNLGTVSVFGPTRMDYRHAITTVRGAAVALSEYVEGVFE